MVVVEGIRTVPIQHRGRGYSGYGISLLDIVTAFNPVLSYIYLKSKERKPLITKAFKSVYGRKPSDEEVYAIELAYVRNRQLFGDNLKNRSFVLELQKSLNAVIPNKIVEDGIFYYQTVCGIKKFQEMSGISSTGILNKATIVELVKKTGNIKLENFLHKGTDWKKLLLIAGIILIPLMLLRN